MTIEGIVLKLIAKINRLMELTVLGCGDAFASQGRFNTSFLLATQGRKVLVDCGASTLIRLKQLHIPVLQIETIIITHFHGDHYGGLPFLMLSNHIEYQRTTPLTIIGPSGIREKAYQLQEALYPGTSHIIDSLGVSFVEYQDAEWIAAGDMDIYARTVTHAPPSNPHGVKIRWQGSTFAFSGDTEWNDSLTDLAEGSDLFIIECNNLKQDSPGHLSYHTILEKHTSFNTKRLMLTHMGSQVIAQPSLQVERLEDGMQVSF